MKENLVYDEKIGMTFFDWVLTIISGTYIISPIDFIPDVVPVAGWMDDVLIGISGISTVIKSQLTMANGTLVSMLKFIRFISFALWAIVGILILILGTLIYQIFS